MPDSVPISISRVEGTADLPLPRYESAGAAGIDLRAAIPTTLRLNPGQRLLVPTGIRIALPDGYEAQVRPRSGLALEQGIALLNSPGTIDPDYRGETAVILINLGSEPVEIQRGLRIAQLVIAPFVRINWHEVEELPPTVRGAGGFGHTGR